MKLKINEFKGMIELKDKFARSRHGEKLEITNLRFDIATKLLGMRDNVSGKRHKERLDLMLMKYGKK